MDNPHSFIRTSRVVSVTHSEAFQLMLYEAKYEQHSGKIVPIGLHRWHPTALASEVRRFSKEICTRCGRRKWRK